MSTPTITEFLEARIAEDEADALPFRNELGDTKQWQCDEIGGAVRYVGRMEFGLPDLLAKFDTHLEGAHVARWDPARVLAECAAKRAIVQLHGEANRNGYDNATAYLWDALYALGSVYRMHPDYQQGWGQ